MTRGAQWSTQRARSPLAYLICGAVPIARFADVDVVLALTANIHDQIRS